MTNRNRTSSRPPVSLILSPFQQKIHINNRKGMKKKEKHITLGSQISNKISRMQHNTLPCMKLQLIYYFMC